VITLVLSLLLLVGTLVLIGSRLSQPSLPPPFGLASNGLIAADVNGAIVVQRPDGTDAHRVEIPFSNVAGMSFSRDGTRLAAWSSPDVDQMAHRVLVVSNVDGSNAYEIEPDTRFLATSWRIEIDWAPDGRHLAFSADSDQIYIADVVERRIDPLGPSGTQGRDPAWSPDGRLAYRCDRDGRLHLCVNNGNGSEERILPTSPGTLYAFQASSWSNDGTRIAYYVDDLDGTGGWDVAVIDLATLTERILTRDTVAHTIFPVWTPDDRHILVNTGGIAAIVPLDGSGTRLVNDVQDCRWVEASPDGRYVTCAVPDGIALIPIEGGPPIRLPMDGTGSTVSWQRLEL
jgi:hypothetical protein